MIIIPYAIMFLFVVLISILWTRGIDKNKNIDKDDIEFP
jgi:hypothetical protein